MKCHDVIKCKLLRAAASVYLCMRFEILTAIIIIFLEREAVCSRNISTFSRNILPPSSRPKSKPCTQQAGVACLLLDIVLIPEDGYSAFLGNVSEFMRRIPLMRIRRTAVRDNLYNSVHSDGCRATSFC